jgi:hypothetical protein
MIAMVAEVVAAVAVAMVRGEGVAGEDGVVEEDRVLVSSAWMIAVEMTVMGVCCGAAAGERVMMVTEVEVIVLIVAAAAVRGAAAEIGVLGTTTEASLPRLAPKLATFRPRTETRTAGAQTRRVEQVAGAVVVAAAEVDRTLRLANRGVLCRTPEPAARPVCTAEQHAREVHWTLRRANRGVLCRRKGLAVRQVEDLLSRSTPMGRGTLVRAAAPEVGGGAAVAARAAVAAKAEAGVGGGGGVLEEDRVLVSSARMIAVEMTVMGVCCGAAAGERVMMVTEVEVIVPIVAAGTFFCCVWSSVQHLRACAWAPCPISAWWCKGNT